MLTPRFSIVQDADFVTLRIRAPYAKVAATDVSVDGCELRFASPPYFLRLTFDERLVEDGREAADYDVDTGFFTVRVPKETPGEEFRGLDMMTKLLAPPATKNNARPTISEIGGEANDEEEEEEEEVDWFVEQVPMATDAPPLPAAFRYGFANQKSGALSAMAGEFVGVFDVLDPDALDLCTRRSLRLQQERDAFSDDHYLYDLHDNADIDDILAFRPWWEEGATAVEFTDEERDQMLRLPARRHLLDGEETRAASLGMVDVVTAYAHDARCTLGDGNSESAWTVCKLSATLSWFDAFSSVDDVVTATARRCLCFPLHRHFALAAAAARDAARIFALGRGALLRCLLAVHRLLSEGDARYVLNDLYVTDYCVWLQACGDATLTSLAAALASTTLTKAGMGLDVEELEAAALACIAEELEAAAQACIAERDAGGDVAALTRKAGRLRIREAEDDSDDDDSDDDDSDDDDDDDDDSDDDDDDDDDDSDDDSEGAGAGDDDPNDVKREDDKSNVEAGRDVNSSDTVATLVDEASSKACVAAAGSELSASKLS
ncbi:PREDICTED: protein SHQ1 homolog [Priapulus caudatus]|uniref:Protein SHQ1 homolog n=1 Tax=Priapulus caudatus TaxID=37621 RepID=A0ABM1EK77_PRICU|nr:PREDICTED: protein SHQ1 homolog [Priapulus caudatus]XP_014672597.1 PREDICTED: protein SHQ1 homolog [Priapulus caudatus]XP_014672598.1 PREDICTED: protein SHQ1 homolog [Priapulus caudatus]